MPEESKCARWVAYGTIIAMLLSCLGFLLNIKLTQIGDRHASVLRSSMLQKDIDHLKEYTYGFPTNARPDTTSVHP